MYLNLFQEIGFQVTFISENLEKIEPYTTILQQKGIEVLYGDWYKNNLENWMKNNLKYFKYVYFQSPKTIQKYIDLIRLYFPGKIFYFAQDLHYIKLSAHDEESKNKSEIFSKIEMEKYFLKLISYTLLEIMSIKF